MVRHSYTVTRDKWHVSCTTSSISKDVTLSVFVPYDRPNPNKIPFGGIKYRHGEGHGKVFKTVEEAYAWALSHGYLQVYYRNSVSYFELKLNPEHFSRRFRRQLLIDAGRKVSFSKKSRTQSEFWR